MNDTQHTICRTVCEWVAEHFAEAEVLAILDDDTETIYETRQHHLLLCCAWVNRHGHVRVVLAPGLRRAEPFRQLQTQFSVALPKWPAADAARHPPHDHLAYRGGS